MYKSRDRSELERDFIEAFHRLRRAGEAFDNGDGFEAASIASSVYVFVHDASRKQPSLMTMLGIKEGTRFFDSARAINPDNLLSEHPLVIIQLGGGHSGYAARKDTGNEGPLPPLAFSRWWEKAVLRDSKRRLFSRKNLITLFRNDRGGGHVSKQYQPRDGVPAEALAELANGDSDGWLFNDKGGTYRPLYHLAYASVRQIGWELEQTLTYNYNYLIKTPINRRITYK